MASKLPFWIGIGAAQIVARSKRIKLTRGHWVISVVLGILLALLIAAGLLILFSVNDEM
jgi:hypothetical protein